MTTINSFGSRDLDTSTAILYTTSNGYELKKDVEMEDQIFLYNAVTGVRYPVTVLAPVKAGVLIGSSLNMSGGTPCFQFRLSNGSRMTLVYIDRPSKEPNTGDLSMEYIHTLMGVENYLYIDETNKWSFDDNLRELESTIDSTTKVELTSDQILAVRRELMHLLSSDLSSTSKEALEKRLRAHTYALFFMHKYSTTLNE